MAKQTEDKTFDLVKYTINLINKHGVFKIIFACVLMMFVSYATYITLNPSILFERYSQYEEKKHTDSFNYRMESTPVIESLLVNLRNECNASRVFIIEMHNGKYNSSGLSFNFGSLTYEAVNADIEPVREDYSDFTLSKYNLFNEIYKKGLWKGNIEDLRKIDKRLALKMESNGCTYTVAVMLYGSKQDIGFLVTEFVEPQHDVDLIVNRMRKYSLKIAPYLDGQNAINY